jgi:hypothetical protein
MEMDIPGVAECPDWYAIIQAAKYLGVSPWDLLQAGVWWQDRALDCMTVEKEAQDVKNKPKK